LHEQAHQQTTSLLYPNLQLNYSDLSCSIGFSLGRYSSNRQFGQFIEWYHTVGLLQFCSLSTRNQLHTLKHTTRYTIARRAARDIIFSCYYYSEIPDPKFLIIYLLQRYTTFIHYSSLGMYFANPYDLYIDTDYQVENLINLPEELEPLETSYISNSSLQLTQYSDPTNITYLEDSSFSEGSISYQLLINTFPPESETGKMLASGSTSKVENIIQDLTDSFKKMSLNLVQQDNKKKAYTVKSEEETTFIKIEISEEDPNQDLEIIEEIHLEVKKGIEEILKIIIIMTKADLEIIIAIIKTDNKETTSTNHWDTLLNNTSIREALANYLQGDSNIAIEGQSIVSKVDDDWEEEYENEELIPYEAYTLEAESNNIEDSG
ncbi:31511_t:CDS:2, partial [Racocetra persica]